jgi:hypothetical protein
LSYRAFTVVAVGISDFLQSVSIIITQSRKNIHSKIITLLKEILGKISELGKKYLNKCFKKVDRNQLIHCQIIHISTKND